MRLDRPSPVTPALPMAALVDILFIVLCFLFLVARFADTERLDVVLPSTSLGTPVADLPVVLALGPDGSLTLDGVAIDEASLVQALAARRVHADRALVVADRDTPLQRAVDLLGITRQAGFSVAGIATRPAGAAP